MLAFYKKHKSVRVMLKILFVLLIILIIALIFTRVYPEFGGRVTKKDREDYKKRAASYYNGSKFVYPKDWILQGVEADERVSDKGKVPKDALPVLTPSIKETPDVREMNITWFGHSTLLIQMHGKNILVDPIFSQRAFMFQFAGPKRFTEPPLEIEELPHIDVVLISHDHYDHLDMQTIKQLAEKTDHFLIPLGIDKHLERWGVPTEKIQNMAWWEEYNLDGLTIACTPTRHMCGRGIDDSNEKLWSSWVLKDEYHQIFESGDSSYGKHFEKIHDKYGDFDLVMLDCAQYSVYWRDYHMFPEESASAAKMLGAKEVMPIHWGAFVLATHAWDDPAERYAIAAEKEGLNLVTPKLGETMILDEADNYRERWWRDYQ